MMAKRISFMEKRSSKLKINARIFQQQSNVSSSRTDLSTKTDTENLHGEASFQSCRACNDDFEWQQLGLAACASGGDLQPASVDNFHLQRSVGVGKSIESIREC